MGNRLGINCFAQNGEFAPWLKKKGGLTVPVFDCIFHGQESIESFIREFDGGLYNSLPNLYAICFSDNSSSPRNIVAGCVVKTSFTHHDEEFSAAVLAPRDREVLHSPFGRAF